MSLLIDSGVDLVTYQEKTPKKRSDVVSLAELFDQRGVGTPHGDRRYNSHLLIGQPRATEDMAEIGVGWQKGVWDLLHFWFGKIELTGSILTLPLKTTENERKGLTAALDNVNYTSVKSPNPNRYDNDLVRTYYRGEISRSKMSRDANLFLDLILGWQDTNADFGFETVRGGVIEDGEIEEITCDLRDVLRLQASYPVDGGPRSLSEIDYYGRMKLLHIDEQGLGGINFFINPSRRKWETTNWRRAQRSKVFFDEEKNLASVRIQDLPDEPLTWLGNVDRLGTWAFQTARAIRLLVVHGKSDSEINVESFLNERERLVNESKTEWSYEEIVGLYRNLIPARKYNPTLVDSLLSQLNLSPIVDMTAWWSKTLTNVEVEIYGNNLKPDPKFSEAYGHLSDLAHEMAAVTSFTTPDQIVGMVPRIFNINEVTYYPIGTAGNIPIVKKRVMEIFRKWERIARTEGNLVLETSLRDSRNALWRWKHNVGSLN